MTYVIISTSAPIKAMQTADSISRAGARWALLAVVLVTLTITGCRSTGETAAPANGTSVITPPPPPPPVPERVARNNGRGTAGVALDTVRAGRFDDGRMWTFDFPPVEYLRETYGITADEAWLERARLGALRIPGCSASFVSGDGLVLTNHHCARDQIAAVTRDGEGLLDDGFIAGGIGEERTVDGMWADQLVGITDVTDEIHNRIETAQTDAERAEARRAAIEAVVSRIRQQAGPGHNVEVISLYNGARYSAYTFRRYSDVRLVMAPELQLGYYGGDADNFTYPRYSLDMTFFRVYDGGRPLRTANYYPWSEAGFSEGDPVFILGNPGSTNRLETVAQLEFRRDVSERYLLDWINLRVAALESHLADNPSDEIRNQLFGLLNAQKLYEGRLRGLQDPVLMARRRDTERRIRAAIDGDDTMRGTYGGLHVTMQELQTQRREYAASHAAFFGLTPQSSLGSAVMRRAMIVARMEQQRSEGAGPDQLAPLRQQLQQVQDQPRDLQERYLADRLAAFRQHLGASHEAVEQILGGRTPADVASSIMRESRLVQGSDVNALVDGGGAASDPAVRAASAVLPLFADYQSAFAGLGAREQDIASRLGRARFEIDGPTTPPDATFSLRIADGVVRGYEYNGTLAPAFTTYYGMYDRFHSFGEGTEWDLPAVWRNRPASLTLSTPLNFVSTNDIIGGNSGSPVLNANLELIGLVFDGNIESLPSSFIYQTERARAVSVDARGMIEALEAVYGAAHIVNELRAGRLEPVRR
jgi:hypothetical protein